MIIVFVVVGLGLVAVALGIFYFAARRGPGEASAAHVAAGRSERQGEQHKARAEGRGDL